ncbi:hypothetical protein C3L33_04094, partial [Rhododendron williamsianum]
MSGPALLLNRRMYVDNVAIIVTNWIEYKRSMAVSVAQVESPAPLSGDLFYDILRRLDGATLASAACTCAALRSISQEERLWENVCSSMWPSTNREDIKSLIESIGGYKKFYADCFPLIVNKQVPEFRWNDYPEYPEEWTEAEYYGDTDDFESVLPSDFISIVDIRYKDKTICSKVLWGIPNANGSNGWFYNCPFRVDLLTYSAIDDDQDDEITLSVSDGLPPISSMERERKDGSFGRIFGVGYDLVGLVIRTEEGGEGCRTTLKLKELSMQLGDMEGAHVNGRNSLLVLKEALSCRRSGNYSEALESCHLYSKAQSELKEEKMRNENRLERMFILSGIAAFASFCYYLL